MDFKTSKTLLNTIISSRVETHTCYSPTGSVHGNAVCESITLGSHRDLIFVRGESDLSVSCGVQVTGTLTLEGRVV